MALVQLGVGYWERCAELVAAAVVVVVVVEGEVLGCWLSVAVAAVAVERVAAAAVAVEQVVRAAVVVGQQVVVVCQAVDFDEPEDFGPAVADTVVAAAAVVDVDYIVAAVGEVDVAVVAAGTAVDAGTRWTVDHFVVDSQDLGDADRPDSDANSLVAGSLAVDELDIGVLGLGVPVAADYRVDCFAEQHWGVLGMGQCSVQDNIPVACLDAVEAFLQQSTAEFALDCVVHIPSTLHA